MRDNRNRDLSCSPSDFPGLCMPRHNNLGVFKLKNQVNFKGNFSTLTMEINPLDISLFNIRQIKKTGPIQAALILYCLIDRIPIIISGDDKESVASLVGNLTSLLEIRDVISFGMSEIEFDAITDAYDNEMYNDKQSRFQIECIGSLYTLKALRGYDNFLAWIFGIESKEEPQVLQAVENNLYFKSNPYLIVRIKTLEDKRGRVQLEGETILVNKRLDKKNLEFELKALDDADSFASVKFVKMKKVFGDKTALRSRDIDQDLLHSLLNFDDDTLDAAKKLTIIRIREFEAGCRRVFSILSRLRQLKIPLEGLGLPSLKIGKFLLARTIDVEDDLIDRMLSFISKEWHFLDVWEFLEEEEDILGDKLSSMGF